MTDIILTEENSTMGDRMAHAREALGLSQEHVAQRLGVKKSTIKKWENDRSEPRANRLYMLAGILNANVMWLMTGQGETPVLRPDDHEVDRLAIRTMIQQLRNNIAEMERNIQALESCL